MKTAQQDLPFKKVQNDFVFCFLRFIYDRKTILQSQIGKVTCVYLKTAMRKSAIPQAQRFEYDCPQKPP